jgi:hypothetical protein
MFLAPFVEHVNGVDATTLGARFDAFSQALGMVRNSFLSYKDGNTPLIYYFFIRLWELVIRGVNTQQQH